MIIMDKPAGMFAIPDRFAKEASLLQYVRRSHPEATPAHRLDRDTSGVMCFATTAAHLSGLAQQWQARTVEKVYWAIVGGSIEETGSIDKPLVESETKRGTMIIHKKGKSALTHFKKIKDWGRYAMLEVNIETGRMHQIRVHLAHIGAPLMVDGIYGGTDAFYLSSIKRKYKGRSVEKPLISRHTLHARRLVLDHPVTGERLSFEADLPKDLRALINQLDRNLG
jgi:23S rRNA pseudouridine955/2504/2580 synthase/23S rRNA pseudouridine1911/1915/1917 synthase